MTQSSSPLSRTTDIAAYVSARINEPWERDRRHCWVLVREGFFDLFGINLPPVIDVVPAGRIESVRCRRNLIANHAEREHWIEVAEPRHPSLVTMAPLAFPHRAEHCGIYLGVDGGGILHVDHPHGVVFDTPTELNLRGWSPSYFVRKDFP